MPAPMSRPARRALTGVIAALLVIPLASCAESPASTNGTRASDSAGSATGSAAPKPAVAIKTNFTPGAKAVKVSKLVRLSADNGTFSEVSVHTLKGSTVAGGLNADKSRWLATSRLEPGEQYAVQAVASNAKGTMKSYKAQFATQALTLDEQTFPSITPLAGQTVGVAMPVMIHFDLPVTDRKKFQRHMSVTSSAGQKGSFHWIDDHNVHYRPQQYWKAGSKVTVNVDVNSIPAGNGIYGQKDRKITFDVGRRMVSKVNMRTDQLQVFQDQKLVKTIPVTTGMPGFTTRSGTKVIIERDRRHDMNSETIGLDPNGPNGYNLKGVEYAMRVTFSGEFLHAAPWSVGSQGHANVSHGCTGMSTSNAGWLFDHSMVGDPVEFTGSNVGMTLTNGYGDWNLSWADWQKGSAL